MSERLADPWLVLRTRSRQERIVEAGLRQKRINAYLPRRSVERRWKDRKARVETPLFPGYVFVQPRADQYENVRLVRGSCGFVLAGGRPAAMPERDLEAVKIMVDSGADLAVDEKLHLGQRVEVIAGPFAGLRGELIRVKTQERLVINAHLLNSSVSVEVESEQIAVI